MFLLFLMFYLCLCVQEDKSIRKKKLVERKPLLEACDQVRTNLVGMGFDVKDHGKSSHVASN